VNGWGEVGVFWFVRVLKSEDFPVFGNPMRMACMSDFFIPCFFPLPDFFALLIFSLSFLYLVLSSALRFSAPLWVGIVESMFCKACNFSSRVWARLYSFSACRNSGWALIGIRYILDCISIYKVGFLI